ncbi:L,D-transpeptidase family protein [Geomesophilobacter sediminis]|uniref:L,D-transpeptidase family protein n=1 Tax=Geomesophilobacter sediminis TaxID=2798584 RepID=A0A8J7LU05_9BACT|nr:L,D-transpeptidase family protein [Geomesophilobacter sediminis]MBJ6724019.1 L,D-transpeptidase family protein [Geomesophilobacter sediminis]
MPLKANARFCLVTLLVVAALALLGGCKTSPQLKSDAPINDDALAGFLSETPIDAEQLLVVIGDGPERTGGRLFGFERHGDHWIKTLGPFPASVGRKGFAPPGEKREGDGRTPSGLFPLEFVFGYAPGYTGSMPYRQATAADIWVDDVNSPDYNTWVRRGETSATSFENMLLPDKRYRHGVVIGYNRNPVVKGKGSAIFIHSWLQPGTPTAGCVALEEGGLVWITEWLRPEKRPQILMGNAGDLVATVVALRKPQ